MRVMPAPTEGIAPDRRAADAGFVCRSNHSVMAATRSGSVFGSGRISSTASSRCPVLRFCPDCRKGKVYEAAPPGVLVRIVGQAPVQARVYELQKLRCNLCGKVFTAQAPQGAGSEKYDATAASMIALAALRSAAQHEAEVRERAPLQSAGRAAGEPGHSPAGLDPVGHPPRHRRYGRAGL